MQLTQEQLLEILKNMTTVQSDDWARLFLRKKNENMFRNALTIALESYCRTCSNSPLEMAVHEYEQKTDVAIIKGTQQNSVIQYIPETLIELKFTNAYWIIKKEFDPVGEPSKPQDNIWRENAREKNLGEEGGIKQDLVKLIKKQENYTSPIAIHHVLALVNPHQAIPSLYAPLIDKWGEKNNYLQVYQGHQRLFKRAVDIFTKQLVMIEQSFLGQRRFKVGSTSIFIGTGFGTAMDLGFVVISEEVHHK